MPRISKKDSKGTSDIEPSSRRERGEKVESPTNDGRGRLHGSTYTILNTNILWWTHKDIYDPVGCVTNG